MAVDIENIVGQNPNILDAGFLARFGQRDLHGIALAVGVSTQLKPAIEFAVMRQQHVGLRPV